MPEGTPMKMRTGRFGVLAALASGFVVASCGSGGDQSGVTVGSTTEALVRVPRPANSYSLFEALQVRPLALSADGKTLFAVNTPDGRLEIFKVHGHGRKLKPIGSVTVGMEPVAVAVRNEHEVWVVNQLSDSVSVVEVGHGGSARVV